MTTARPAIPLDLPAPPPRRTCEHDFSHLLPAGAWQSLDPDIRRRFAGIAACPASHFTGQMTVKRSLIGLLFAVGGKLIGSPNPIAEGDGVTVDVDVFHTTEGGVCWQRVFHFGERRTTIRSMKVIDPRHGLLEVVEGGIGMTLNAMARDGALVFESTRYFLEFGLFRLPLPDFISPGKCTVEHIDEGNGNFRFRLSMRHAIFGQTILQDGIFSETAEGEP
jgi:hypothetical protein